MRATAWLLRGYRVLSKGQGPFSRAAKALELQEMNMQSRARVYADVNVTRPRDYWDYETLSIQWGCAGPACIGAPGPARGSPTCPTNVAWTITWVISTQLGCSWRCRLQMAFQPPAGSPSWPDFTTRLGRLGLVSPRPADSGLRPVYHDQPSYKKRADVLAHYFAGLPSRQLPGKLVMVCSSPSALAWRPSLCLCSSAPLC